MKKQVNVVKLQNGEFITQEELTQKIRKGILNGIDYSKQIKFLQGEGDQSRQTVKRKIPMVQLAHFSHTDTIPGIYRYNYKVVLEFKQEYNPVLQTKRSFNEVKKVMKTDKFITQMFKSSDGGLIVVGKVKTPIEFHTMASEQFEDYLLKSYGLSTFNFDEWKERLLTPLYFSFDPTAHYNLKAKAFPVEIPQDQIERNQLVKVSVALHEVDLQDGVSEPQTKPFYNQNQKSWQK